MNRERILDAALTAVRRDGTSVPMATVAAEAGVGVGTLYRHFAGRADLLDAVSRHAFAMVLRCARDADRPEGTGLECLAAFFAGTVAHADRLVLPLHGGPTPLSAATLAVRREVHEALQIIVDRGIADASVRADATTWDIIAFGALVAQPLPTVEDWRPTALRLVEIHLDGLRRPSPGPDPG